MGTVKSITGAHIRAASSPDGVPTFWVSGVVGFDFKGLDLASAVASLGEVRLLLDTVGGDAADAFAFYDAVRVRGLKVHVEGYGRVASAGTVIMAAAGRSRSFLAPNAEYLIHEASGPDEVVVERYNERMARIYSELSGMTEKEVRKIMKEDRFMSAQEAKKLKLVGGVLQHEAIAAQYKAMEEQTIETVEQAPIEAQPEAVEQLEEITTEIPVTVPEAIQAAITGHFTAKVKVATEFRETIAQLTTDLRDVQARADEYKSEADDLREKLSASEDARTKAEAKAAELEPKVAEITAQLEALRATPVAAAAVTAEAKEVQVPGGGPSANIAKSKRPEKLAKLEETMRAQMGTPKPKA